jgi:hypothetical protein
MNIIKQIIEYYLLTHGYLNDALVHLSRERISFNTLTYEEVQSIQWRLHSVGQIYDISITSDAISLERSTL